MAKHRFQSTRRVFSLWPGLDVLVMILAMMPAWAGQGSLSSSPSSPPNRRDAGNGKGPVTPTNSAKTAAQRRSPTSRVHGFGLGEGRRDPFRLPPSVTGKVGNSMSSFAAGSLPPGARGLLISQLKLEGIVREQTANKMIAVVTNDTKRAYFLSENEAVYDGVVSRITPDALYFTENVLDTKGRVTTREVVKRLGLASGEGR